MKKTLMPLNIQFFADEATEAEQPKDTSAEKTSKPAPEAKSQNDKAKDNDDTGEFTVEQLLAVVADLKAQNAKQKADFDKLMTSEGNLRKQLRAKLTAEEAEAEAKAEQEAQFQAYVKGLERENAVHRATERYIGLGMTKELATATAELDVDGKNEEVTANFKKFMEDREKAHEAELRQKYLGEMANMQSGNGVVIDYTKQKSEAIENHDMQAYAALVMQEAMQV